MKYSTLVLACVSVGACGAAPVAGPDTGRTGGEAQRVEAPVVAPAVAPPEAPPEAAPEPPPEAPPASAGAEVAERAVAAPPARIPGTAILDTAFNREVVAAVEAYRDAMERIDTTALLRMASHDYREDGGTPASHDDYDYDGLRVVLENLTATVTKVVYSIRYLRIARVCERAKRDTNVGCRAVVDVEIDASYIFAGKAELRSMGRRVNQMVLEWSGDRWLFLSGM